MPCGCAYRISRRSVSSLIGPLRSCRCGLCAKAAARLFVGRHDFSAFRNVGCQVHAPARNFGTASVAQALSPVRTMDTVDVFVTESPQLLFPGVPDTWVLLPRVRRPAFDGRAEACRAG